MTTNDSFLEMYMRGREAMAQRCRQVGIPLNNQWLDHQKWARQQGENLGRYQGVALYESSYIPMPVSIDL